MSLRDLPPFSDLRAFLAFLEGEGDLKRIDAPVDIVHEMTALHRRVLVADGPALRFDQAHSGGARASMPAIANLFGAQRRVAAGLGVRPERVGELGEMLAA